MEKGAPQQPAYGQPAYGQPPQGYAGQPQFGQAPYGAPPGQAPYGVPPGQAPYGAPPGQAPYGAPPGMIHGQPAVGQWMARPEGIPGCPPGLEYLCQVDQLLVKQQMELLEAFTGFETSNKYKVQNSMGQQVYFAAEESDMCMRQCCGPQRGFTIHITDNAGQEVIRVTREFKCCVGCPWFACNDSWAHVVQIEAPVGQIVGYVKQRQSCIEPHYIICNAEHEEVFSMTGPCCIIQGPCCTWDQDFIVNSKDGQTEVGKISKQWSGLLREYFTDADNFGISFPMDLDVKLKAVMLGAVFLIDFMYFEQNQQNNNNRGYM
ncbi:phospholipid scramblase 2-like isoform X2 [Ruditapes philippinarum]|uniref:phospholipid scramblase 2-like isoform X2 n=1 Tax=Ruditapes philippinarum TaxID=129788 RepID=UPI00295B35B1|nr:phospholipid scramblase 2-like isoform X2 [Ruditapes philippinarum]